jgi:hypothetical protein
MNSLSALGSFMRKTYYVLQKYIFPSVDASLVFYYPLDSSNGSINAGTANYASGGLPIYDASMMGLAMNTYALTNLVSGLGDLSLNNTMGATATSYVKSDTSFNLVPSRGLSISLWFSCSGQVDTSGTLISLYQDSSYPSIELDIVGNRLFSRYFIPPNVVSSITPTTSNGYYIYTFTDNGTITFNNNTNNQAKSITITAILVGGGGGGGIGAVSTFVCGGGGGGGGGVGNGTITIPAISKTTLNITIGKGGQTSTTPTTDNKGNDSTIIGTGINETAYGGGGGQTTSQYTLSAQLPAYNNNCGSGGGGVGFGFDINGPGAPGGVASKGNGSNLTYYGNNGGRGAPRGTTIGGGGGGGAGSTGSNSVNSNAAGGVGGTGKSFTIAGNTYGLYGAGGNGGTDNSSNANGNSGTINTGNGGTGGNTKGGSGGSGGSGICILFITISDVA